VPEQSHDRCRTCLCGGALPAGSTATDRIPDSTGMVEFVPLKFGETKTSTAFRSLDRHVDRSPLYGRLMLALYCELLL
jgi:hypothetical protein